MVLFSSPGERSINRRNEKPLSEEPERGEYLCVKGFKQWNYLLVASDYLFIIGLLFSTTTVQNYMTAATFSVQHE